MSNAPLSPDIQAALAQLHDIRVPDPVGWWPLAPGWWALIAIVLAAIAVALWRENRRRRSAGYLALRELDMLRDRLKASDNPRAVGVDLAVLLRRVALNMKDRQGAIAVSGQAWIDRLTDGESGLSPAIARFVANAPYAPANGTTDADITTLRTATDEAERWIRRRT